MAHTWLFARLSVPPEEKAILAPLCAIGEIVDTLRAHDPAACWLFQRAKSGGHRRLELWLRAERDVLDTLSGRLVAEPATGAYNIASGAPGTVLDLARALAGALDRPDLEPLVTGEWRGGDVRHVFASPKRSADVLGFRAEVPFSDGVAELASRASATTLSDAAESP